MTASDEGDDLVVERHGATVVLRMNRPDARNSLTRGLMFRLGEQLGDAESDVSVRAVVVTATGDRAFCAGMDLAAFAAGEGVSADEDDPRWLTFQRFTAGELTVPVIGAANGAAVGGGFELLLGCDMVVAAEGARFGLPEVKRGLFASGGGTWIGTRIPLTAALELALTGELIDASRAYELGLVNRVVSPDALMDTALELAAKVAANGPLALRATKELVRLGVVDPVRARERYRHWLPVVFESEDAREGASSFVERREPVWRGR